MGTPTNESVYSLHHFVGDFANWVKAGHDIRYCFVLGAGASRSSGIPTGAGLVDEWLLSRFEQECPGASHDGIATWAKETFRNWPNFTWESRAAFYGPLYSWFYRDNATGQAALRQLIRGKSPSFGYSVLATILAKTNHKVILTTNFDNLVRDALSLHVPDEDPFICHGEDDARFLAGHATRIRIAKLHGDIDRKTYNAAPEIKKLHEAWDHALRGIFTEYTPIFLGYSGSDCGVMDFLTEKLTPGQFRARPIWSYRVDAKSLEKSGSSTAVPPGWPDGEQAQKFMARHNGMWLPIPGFDEFMLLLSNSLSYGNQATLIRGEADRRAQDYERTLADALKALAVVPCKSWCPQIEYLAAEAELRLLGKTKQRTWDEWRVAVEAATSRDETARLLEEASKELNESPELKAFQAAFIADDQPNAPSVDETIQQARVLAEKSSGIDSPVMWNVLYNHACIHCMRGHFQVALDVAKDVLRRQSSALGAEHPDTLKTTNLVANCLSELGNVAEAATLHRKAFDAYKRTLGEEHPRTLGSLNNLALSLSELGNFAEAATLHRKAFDAYKRTFGEEHPDTLHSLDSLAACLCDLGNSAEAATLHRIAFDAYRRTLGDEHPDTLSSLNNLALSLSELGNFAEAASIHHKVLDVHRRTLGDEHPDTLRSLDNLAIPLSQLGNVAEAATLHRKVLDARKRTLGEEHPDTLHSLNNLATCLSELGNVAEAATLHCKAFDAYKRTLGEEHPDTLRSLENLATCLSELGNVAEAATLHRKAFDVYRRTLGEEHPDSLNSLNNLARCLSHLGNEAEAEKLWQQRLAIVERK